MTDPIPHRSLPRIILALVAVFLPTAGCFSKRTRDRSEAVTQAIAEQKLQTDNLRNAMRYLNQITPVTRSQVAKEVQLELNTWLAAAERTNIDYSPSQLLRFLPDDLLEQVGCKTPVSLKFNEWDVDFLYERRITSKLSAWIVDFPVRDSLMLPILDKYAEQLSDVDKLKLYESYKLFDWTIRNIAMESGASSVEELTLDPQGPISDDGIGYGYLPWETLLFSAGDFVERGRVFTALADQRDIDTVWISVGGSDDQPGSLWAIGVVIADEILLFEPKLGMPILDPDEVELATLGEAIENERVLRRLDLAGQFDYALTNADLETFSFLIDVPPVAGSFRMKLLEKSLLSDERMRLYHDVDALSEKLQSIAPDHAVRIWETPLLAQVQADAVRERLQTLSPYSMSYMAKHGVWLYENPAAQGRLKHLFGDFENTLDSKGALYMYINSRVDDESIAKLAYDPEVQKGMGLRRAPQEGKEQYEMRIMQAQMIFGLSKVDAAYLLAQLHFDRGNYSACEDFLRKRVVEDQRAERWWPTGHYLLSRAYEEAGDLEKAAAELTYQPSPQEAGNRLRLRYLRREVEE